MKESEYNIELHFGYEESKYGISHEFEVTDPNLPIDANAMEKHLAEMLQCETESDHFNFNCMQLPLPDTVVARIKKAGIEEYLADKETAGA